MRISDACFMCSSLRYIFSRIEGFTRTKINGIYDVTLYWRYINTTLYIIKTHVMFGITVTFFKTFQLSPCWSIDERTISCHMIKFIHLNIQATWFASAIFRLLNDFNTVQEIQKGTDTPFYSTFWPYWVISIYY